MAEEKVEFSSKVPQEEYERFKKRFPQYGAVGWFINSSLKTFNDLCELIPDSQEMVNRSINLMLAQNRGAKPDNEFDLAADRQTSR